MRTIYGPAALLFLMLFSCQRDQVIRIEGTLNGSNRHIIFLDEQQVQQSVPVDSARTGQDGSFHFRIAAEYPKFYNLRLGDNRLIPLLLAPGENVQIHCNLRNFSKDYQVAGSPGSRDLKKLNERLLVTKHKMDSLRNLFKQHPDPSPGFTRKMQSKLDSVIDAQRRYSIGYVLENRSSLAAIYALYQKLEDDNFVLNQNKDIQLLKITAQVLDTLYPASKHVRALVSDAANMEKRLYNSALDNLIDQTESRLPEIALPGMEGDTLRLSQVDGKAIILNFWASWSPASISYNVDLKEIYNRYHQKGLEIYQVSFDNDREKWEKSVRFEVYPWINVIDEQFPNSSLPGKYNVQNLPTSFLIDEQRNIIGRDLNKKALQRKLANIFE